MKKFLACSTPFKIMPVAGLGAALLLSGCAETRLALHAAKKLRAPPDSQTGVYKVGNPYRVGDVWYYPKVDYSYDETGIASWYGPKFHRRRTANGRVFNMNAISAAHRTLPLPSVVRVTNLENGRSLKVRIIDRGPFARGRIIDLSRRAAQLLGFERAGVARVRVRILPDESRRLARLAQGAGATEVASLPTAPAPATPVRAPTVPVNVTPLPERGAAAPPRHSPAADSAEDVKIVPVSAKTNLFVQAGAFIRRDLARKTERDLAPIGPTRIVEATVGERLFYRVRLGPVATVNDGDRILDQVMRTGYPDARLVVY